jgi:hypothetical protein
MRNDRGQLNFTQILIVPGLSSLRSSQALASSSFFSPALVCKLNVSLAESDPLKARYPALYSYGNHQR